MKRFWLFLILLPILCSFTAAYDLFPPPDFAEFAPAVSSFPLSPPLKELVLTGHYGYREDPFSEEIEFHRGADLKAKEGTKVYAVLGGTVIKAAFHKSYGNYLLIDHRNGFQSLYAHCKKLLKKEGEQVDMGECIALSGKTGRTTGPHLHLELSVDGKLVNPCYFWEINEWDFG